MTADSLPANTMTPQSQSDLKKRLTFIDALRGLAALAIVFFHLVYIPRPNLEIPIFSGIINKFGISVTLFFVISAYTLCLSAENRKSEENKILKFYIRRFFRIAPLFYAISAFWVLARIAIWSQETSLLEIIANATFTFNFLPGYHISIAWAGWTIGVEMLFYMVFPFLYSKFNTFKKLLILLLLTIGLAAISVHIILRTSDLPSSYPYMFFLSRFPIFIFGTIVFWLQKKVFKFKGENKQNREKLSFGLLILFTLISIILIKYHSIFNTIPGAIMRIYTYIWAINFSILIISLSLNSNHLIVNKLTCFYGKISYSMYLLHPFLIYALIPVYRDIYSLGFTSPLVKFSICTLTTLAILTPLSMLTFKYIEKPGLKFGKHLISKI